MFKKILKRFALVVAQAIVTALLEEMSKDINKQKNDSV